MQGQQPGRSGPPPRLCLLPVRGGRVVVARVDAELVPARLVEVADRMVLARRESEEPVSGGIARDVALVHRGDRKLEGDVAVGVADGKKQNKSLETVFLC